MYCNSWFSCQCCICRNKEYIFLCVAVFYACHIFDMVSKSMFFTVCEDCEPTIATYVFTSSSILPLKCFLHKSSHYQWLRRLFSLKQVYTVCFFLFWPTSPEMIVNDNRIKLNIKFSLFFHISKLNSHLHIL